MKEYFKLHKQLTKEQAISFAESGIWKEWNSNQIVDFQLLQQLLCVDFGRFHEAMEEMLGRLIWTHEFADYDGLVMEYLGEKEAPPMEDIINMIPADKRILVGITN